MNKSLNDEPELVMRAKINSQAFGTLYDHYFPRVYNYTRYRVRSPVDADDLTALVFERALANLKTFRPRGAPFSAWLFGIARNAINDFYRRQRDHLPLEFALDQAVDEPVPEVFVTHQEQHSALLIALSRLNDRERDLLALKFAADLTHKQIAQLTNMTETSVSVALFRALQRLRSILKEEAHEQP